MRAKDFVPASKPRNFVAKNQKTAGAGAHKDKKRAAKQGDVKHKKQDVDEGFFDQFRKKQQNYGGIDVSVEKEDNNILVKATANGRELGRVLFTPSEQDDNLLVPLDLEVDERYRGQGIGATMYDYVKSLGYTIRRSQYQTDAGAGFWDKHKSGKNVWEQGVAEGWDDIKKFGKKAAVAGAIGLGALGGAQAQDAPSGEDMLPDIVAHVTFKVDGKTITKDINLGTAYKSPGQAGDALAKFLKSKGIKYYDYSLERVKPKDKDYLDKAPYTDSGKAHGQIDTGPAVDTKSKNDYMSKD